MTAHQVGKSQFWGVSLASNILPLSQKNVPLLEAHDPKFESTRFCRPNVAFRPFLAFPNLEILSVDHCIIFGNPERQLFTESQSANLYGLLWEFLQPLASPTVVMFFRSTVCCPSTVETAFRLLDMASVWVSWTPD